MLSRCNITIQAWHWWREGDPPKKPPTQIKRVCTNSLRKLFCLFSAYFKGKRGDNLYKLTRNCLCKLFVQAVFIFWVGRLPFMNWGGNRGRRTWSECQVDSHNWDGLEKQARRLHMRIAACLQTRARLTLQWPVCSPLQLQELLEGAIPRYQHFTHGYAQCSDTWVRVPQQAVGKRSWNTSFVFGTLSGTFWSL